MSLIPARYKGPGCVQARHRHWQSGREACPRPAYATASTAPGFRAAVVQQPGQAGLLRLASVGGQSALNNTAFLARLNPVLGQPAGRRTPGIRIPGVYP